MAKYYPRIYREYRGHRKKGSTALKVIAVLLVLLLIAVSVFVFALGGSVERTEDGLRLVMPWTEDGPDDTPEGESSLPPLIVE